MNNKDAVRYPVGFKERHQCKGILWNSQNPQDNDIPFKAPLLNYIEGRKRVYVPLYKEFVEKQPKFLALKERLRKGENLLIIEVDGPHQESSDYYIEKYKVDKTFIEKNTI